MHQLDSNSELLSLVFSVKITSLASGGKVGGRSGAAHQRIVLLYVSPTTSLRGGS